MPLTRPIPHKDKTVCHSQRNDRITESDWSNSCPSSLFASYGRYLAFESADEYEEIGRAFPRACAVRGRRSRPRGRAVDRAPVRERHHVRQLAPRRQVAGDMRIVGGVIADVGELFAGIKYDNLLPKSTSDQIKRGYEVGVTTQQHEGVGGIAKRIIEHVGRYVHVGTLFLKFDDAHPSFVRLATGSAFGADRRHPSFISVVIALDDIKTINGCKGTQIDSLSLNGRCVVRVCSNPRSIEFDLRKRVIVAKQSTNESDRIEPFQLGAPFEESVVQIPCVNICDCSHYLEMLRLRPFRIGASPRIGRASRSDINPLTGSVGSVPYRRAWRKGVSKKR